MVQGGHEIDVPITDLDNIDSDIVFDSFKDSVGTQLGRSSQSPTLQVDPGMELNEGWLNDFASMDSSQQSSWFSRIKTRISSGLPRSLLSLMDNGYRRTDAYEMVPLGSRWIGESEHDDEPELMPTVPLSKRWRIVLFRVVFGMAFVCFMLISKKWLTFKSPIIVALAEPTIHSNGTHEFHRTTILVSLDGFHPHYISKRTTPALHKMLVGGFSAPYMRPSFPSSTFPNHWTLITGLYPSEHGIVGNTFYDPVLDRQFVNTDPNRGSLDPDFWKGGDPIWHTLARQNLSTAVHMWPGSEVRGGIGPRTDYDPYNESETLLVKADRIMEWLDRPVTTRPQLILAYVPTIDQVGHKYGISGVELTTALTNVDEFVDLVQQNLALRNLTHVVNLVIVSDHGMAPTSSQRLLFIDDLLDMSMIEHIDGWPLFGFHPAPNVTVEEIYQQLQKNMDSLAKEHFKVYRLCDFPPEFQFGGGINAHRFNYRLAPLWIVPEAGYSVTTHHQLDLIGGDYKPHGVHGYNNSQVTMRAIFLSTGPYFETKLDAGAKISPFDNVEIYNILCDSVGAIPSANNGTMSGDSASYVSHKNVLKTDWNDPLGFPDLSFATEHIVLDATYDILWKPQDKAEILELESKSAFSTTSKMFSATKEPEVNDASPTGISLSSETVEMDKPANFFENIAQKLDHAIDDLKSAWDDSDAKSWLHDTADETGKFFGDVFADLGF